jgi:hypothetical protein
MAKIYTSGLRTSGERLMEKLADKMAAAGAG